MESSSTSALASVVDDAPLLVAAVEIEHGLWCAWNDLDRIEDDAERALPCVFVRLEAKARRGKSKEGVGDGGHVVDSNALADENAKRRRDDRGGLALELVPRGEEGQ